MFLPAFLLESILVKIGCGIESAGFRITLGSYTIITFWASFFKYSFSALSSSTIV